MSFIKIIKFQKLGDLRGSLVAIEEKESIPFKIKRVYYIFNTQKNISRGFHAHKNLLQICICLKGHCSFVMDNGRTKEKIELKDPTEGLLIESMIWHEMHDFSEDCVLLVLASDHYKESDYIRNYKEFLKMVKNN